MSRFTPSIVAFALAALSLGALALVHLLGWREETAVIAGNVVSGEAWHGAVYALVWIQAWVVAPIAALAGVGLGIWEVSAPAATKQA